MRSVIVAALVALLLVPARASAIEVFADISYEGDAITYKGWVVDANRNRWHSWRIQLWQEGGDFPVLLDQHTRPAIKGESSFSTPLYYDFAQRAGRRVCVRFYVYKKKKPTGLKRRRSASECMDW